MGLEELGHKRSRLNISILMGHCNNFAYIFQQAVKFSSERAIFREELGLLGCFRGRRDRQIAGRNYAARQVLS
jgi:hypothetical protein